MAQYLSCFLQGDVSAGSGYRTVREPSLPHRQFRISSPLESKWTHTEAWPPARSIKVLVTL